MNLRLQVDEAFAMKKMTEEGRQGAADAARGVFSGGSTNLSGGLFQSIQQIRDALEQDDHGNPGTQSSVHSCHFFDLLI